jgi:hypothetical protein
MKPQNGRTTESREQQHFQGSNADFGVRIAERKPEHQNNRKQNTRDYRWSEHPKIRSSAKQEQQNVRTTEQQKAESRKQHNNIIQTMDYGLRTMDCMLFVNQIPGAIINRVGGDYGSPHTTDTRHTERYQPAINRREDSSVDAEKS